VGTKLLLSARKLRETWSKKTPRSARAYKGGENVTRVSFRGDSQRLWKKGVSKLPSFFGGGESRKGGKEGITRKKQKQLERKAKATFTTIGQRRHGSLSRESK